MVGGRLVGDVVVGRSGFGGRPWLSWIEVLGSHGDCTSFQGRLESKSETFGTSLVVGVGWRRSGGRPAGEGAGSMWVDVGMLGDRP